MFNFILWHDKRLDIPTFLRKSFITFDRYFCFYVAYIILFFIVYIIFFSF